MSNHFSFNPKRTLGVVLWTCLFAFTSTVTARSQGVPVEVRILGCDSSAYPEIRLQALFLDHEGRGISGFSSQNLIVLEDNRPVEFQMEEKEAGSEIGFVLDAGMGLYAPGTAGSTRLGDMKEAIQDIVQDPAFLAGPDAFYVLAQEPSGHQVLAGPGTPASQMKEILSQYNPKTPDRLANPVEGIEYLLSLFEKETPSGAPRPHSIVLLSGILQVGLGSSLESTAARARSLGVPIHTVLVRSAYENEDLLLKLAGKSGGGFYYYHPEGAGGITGLKSRLSSIRRQYAITYRSEGAESGTHAVSVGTASGTVERPALQTYTVTVNPPKAVILTPGNRQTVSPQTLPDPAPPESDRPVETPVKGILVTGAVSWPDGHARKIRRAVLLVNGKPKVTLDSPGDSLTFVWNPDSDAVTGSARLQIQVEDELGLEAESDPVSVKISSGGFSLCPAGGSSPLCNLNFGGSAAVSWIAVGIALAALGLVVVFRRQVAGTAQQAVGAAGEFIQEVGETLRFKHKTGSAKAVLVDLDKSTGTDRPAFDLFGTTTIGRSRDNADLAVQSDRPESPVSRLHCTILEEDGAFFVRDEESANGTYLNGMRLIPLERYPLKDGDEIRLADPEQGGIRMEFRFSAGIDRGAEAVDTESTNRINQSRTEGRG